MTRSGFTIFFIFLFCSISFAEQRYHKVPALPGDGVYSLLRRYKLDEFSCNHTKFYQLNNLRKSSQLKVGRYYAIPLMLYDFDGRTIRSSIGIDNYTLAKNIEIYNDAMFKDGYRKESFRDNLELWVPYHIINCGKADLKAQKPVAVGSKKER